MKRELLTTRRGFLLAGLGAIPIITVDGMADSCNPTATNARGPFYRQGAPSRTRLCGPDEPGESLRISGRVTAADTCKPLRGATIDVWQANADGRYDNDDPGNPPDPNKFLLRGVLKTDNEGRYQFDTVLPGNYKAGPAWRARHIHYIISYPGYAPLTTQCYFEGDEYNKRDSLVVPSLIIGVSSFNHPRQKRPYLKGVFDIVLAKAK